MSSLRRVTVIVGCIKRLTWMARSNSQPSLG